MTDKLADLDDEDDVPQIKLGDASCAAPFTSKLSNVAASTWSISSCKRKCTDDYSSVTAIIRQGRCTLVATIQMYKILALNCLITAWALSVQYLDGIKYGDYQMSITGMLMSVCFLCISRAKVRSDHRLPGHPLNISLQPVEKLSKERPLGNIFNLYVLLSVLLQFALHIVTMVYITTLSHTTAP
jgi:cation-transporting ATPase 13A1